MRFLAETALLDGEIRRDVAIILDDAGRIAGVAADSDAAEGDERLRGLVVPGMPNLHSHAFQRAMAGLAERAGPEGDNFWRWREVMYRFLAVLTPAMRPVSHSSALADRPISTPPASAPLHSRLIARPAD